MSYSDWTPEEYGAWRHKQIKEASDNARDLGNSDFPDWETLKHLQTEDTAQPAQEGKQANSVAHALQAVFGYLIAPLKHLK